ncbi:MAG: RNA 2',3'-cyclic phosphodiesterase [bacterium]
MRTFMAVEIGPETKTKLASLEDELKKSAAEVKWVKPDNIHITLKFLGEVPPGDIEKINKAVETAVTGFKVFRINFREVGGFPSARNPRVIWVGVEEGQEELIRLSQSIERELTPLGWPPEERDFVPHLTIGRVRSNKNIKELGQKIENYKNNDFGQGLVDKVLIMESKLSPKGPTYLVVKEIKLL